MGDPEEELTGFKWRGGTNRFVSLLVYLSSLLLHFMNSGNYVSMFVFLRVL